MNMNIDGLVKSGAINKKTARFKQLQRNQEATMTICEIVIIAFSQVSQYVH